MSRVSRLNLSLIVAIFFSFLLTSIAAIAQTPAGKPAKKNTMSADHTVSADQMDSQSGSSQAPKMPSAEIDARAREILKKMTLEQKVDYIGGVDDFFIRDVPSAGLPRFKMADGPIGVRNYGPATTTAGGISLAATWNEQLARQVGEQIGRDARAKGVHFMLGPGVNIYMEPMNGRNFEYFGEDPFLAARTTVNYILGVQSQGVSSTVKHYDANNSEYDRHNVDVQVDERTLREIYLPAFEAAVKEAHVGAVMDSYNLVNGEHSTQNTHLNTEILKKDWGFQGVLMSDWDATYDGVAAANSGLDLEMPSGKFMNRQNLLPAIQSGKVSEATIDDKVMRILRTAIRFGWLDRDQTDLSISRYNTEGDRVALQAAREGIVLLKNENNTLPLDRASIKTIAVIGPDAYPAVPVGGGSAGVKPFVAKSILEAFGDSLKGSKVFYEPGLPSIEEIADRGGFTTDESGGKPGFQVDVFRSADLSGTPALSHTMPRVMAERSLPPETGNGSWQPKPISSRWTAYFTPKHAGPHYIVVQGTNEAGGFRLFVDDKPVFDQWTQSKASINFVTLDLSAQPHKVVFEQVQRWGWGGENLRLMFVPTNELVEDSAKKIAAKADAVILAVGYDPSTESEGSDRTFKLPFGQEELVQEIAAVNKKTIVVATAGGSYDTAGWLDKVPALLQVWYPGQEGGTAIREIIFGDTNPSGRLPISFEAKQEENPSFTTYYADPSTKKVEYKNGIFIGYRGFEKNNIKPLFPFGYGLSYTTFKFANLSVKPAGADEFDATFDVTNSGKRAGAEVAEVYVGAEHPKVPRPAKELKGFRKVNLAPGQTTHVTVHLDKRAFSYYDVDAKQWQADAGVYDVLVGGSSADIALKGTATLK